MSLNGLLKPVIPTLPSISADKEIETLRMLPTETLFLALKEADTENALWVLENAKPKQIQGIIDLDCWRGDSFLPERFFRYFEFMTYTTPEKLKEYMQDIDPEVIVLSLMDLCEVLDFDPQEPPQVEEDRLILSPDNKYAIILKTPDANLRERIFQWLNKLSAMDIDLMRRHLESLKWENKNDLEEFGYQIKKGRIEELGFVEREEAIRFFSRGSAPELKKNLLDHPLEKSIKEESPLLETLGSDDLLPQPISKAVTDEGFFKKALMNIENTHLLELLRMEVVRTVNAVFTAEDKINEDVETLKDSAARTRAYLDLGLLYLSGGDDKRAAEELKVQPVFDISRLGWILVQDLCKAAQDVKTKYTLNIFESPERELLNALQGKHPSLSHSEILKDLSLSSFDHFTLETLHKTADKIAALGVMGHFFTENLGSSLLLQSEPCEANESAWARLNTALFRQASAREFSAKKLNLAEFNEIKAQWNKETSDKIFKLILEKVPAPAKKLFEKRYEEYTGNLEKLIKSNNVDTKFVKYLRWDNQ